MEPYNKSDKINVIHDEILLIKKDLEFIKSRNEDKKAWIKILFTTFALTILSVAAIAIRDHVTLNTMPEFLKSNYYSKDAVNMGEAHQAELNLFYTTEILKNTKDIQAILKDLERIDDNLKSYRATRGGGSSQSPKIKLPGGIDPDKLYNELMKQKAEGSDTGTYNERVNRINKKLLK